MDYYTSYIILVFIVKLIFITLAVTHIYLRAKGKTDSKLDKNVVYWKDRFEFIFAFLMALLLLYLFNPMNGKSIMISGETKILLYLFGIVLLITAKWGTFIEEANWFKTFQESV
jgi:hypothetical protein